MNAVTQLESTTLEEVLAPYDVGTLARYWPAANGIENSNYFIQTQTPAGIREYVLTVMEQPANAGAAYVPMMEHLEAGGLPVAPPMRTREGLSSADLLGKAAMLQRRMSGKHIYNPTLRQIGALARFIARMHKRMATIDLALPEYPRDVTWLEERSDIVRGYVPFSDQSLIESTVEKVGSMLGRSDVRTLPRGMIHGDLFRDNVLFNDSGLTAVLDFHHAATGFLIYDLAVAANDWCNDASGCLDPERTLHLLREYHQIRPLTSSELWFFSGFTLYSALAFWLSRLAVAVHRDSSFIRFKNPDEFKRIVAHNNRYQFYIDERRLTV